MRNHAPHAQRSHRFALDPLAWLELLEAHDAGALELRGLYHSHPQGPLQLSPTDREAMLWGDRPAYPQLLHLLVSPQRPEAFALYQWEASAGDFIPVETPTQGPS